jgi:hypothetical protein
LNIDIICVTPKQFEEIVFLCSLLEKERNLIAGKMVWEQLMSAFDEKCAGWRTSECANPLLVQVYQPFGKVN